MLHNTCDKGICLFGKTELTVRVVEHVFAALYFVKAHIRMHTAAVDAVNRLGHKGCVESVLRSVSLNNVLKSHNSVGGKKSVAELEVNFVLSFSNLMVRRLNSIAHILKRKADITAAVFAVVNRVKVKISRLVARFNSRLAVLVKLEKEEFTFGTDVEAVAELFRFLHYFD